MTTWIHSRGYRLLVWSRRCCSTASTFQQELCGYYLPKSALRTMAAGNGLEPRRKDTGSLRSAQSDRLRFRFIDFSIKWCMGRCRNLSISITASKRDAWDRAVATLRIFRKQRRLNTLRISRPPVSRLSQRIAHIARLVTNTQSRARAFFLTEFGSAESATRFARSKGVTISECGQSSRKIRPSSKHIAFAVTH